MTRILIVGGGYAGFTTARLLEDQLAPGEAQVTMVDPHPYLTYQPFLPEVVAGSIEPRHAVVSHRRHLKSTRVITAEVTKIDHASKTATITPEGEDAYPLEYDIIVVTAGSVSRTFPIPGVADQAIGLKSIEEAVAIRDRVIDNFNRASNLRPGAERDRLLTFVVVGGGFAGIECFAEMRSLATALLADYPTLQFDDVHFHLIEAAPRIMPEVSEEQANWVVKKLAERGAQVHLNTQLSSAVDGVCELSTGETFASDCIVWTAGVMAAPFVKSNSDLPTEERGRITVRPDLRVEGEHGIIEGAFACGDVAAVPDLSGGGVGGFCVPNAQHAWRQAKVLAPNIVASLRGGEIVDYYHENLGAVAGLGLGYGVFRSPKVNLKGFLAWLVHRLYHGYAIPTVERKIRVFGDWAGQLALGRDFVSLSAVRNPRASFERFASRPKPKQEAPKADALKAPAAKPESANADAVKTDAAKPASASKTAPKHAAPTPNPKA